MRNTTLRDGHCLSISLTHEATWREKAKSKVALSEPHYPT